MSFFLIPERARVRGKKILWLLPLGKIGDGSMSEKVEEMPREGLTSVLGAGTEVNTSAPEEKEILVYKKDTWGTRGQHSNLYVFVIDLEAMTQKIIFEYDLVFRAVRADSSKNAHRQTFVKMSELKKLEGKILKFVHDYATSSHRTIRTEYYLIANGKMLELQSEGDLRDAKGFYEIVYLPDTRKLKIRKDSIEIVA
jgi:hypothetical protein